MSRRAFAAKYGASSRDVGKVVKAFASYGLKKVGTNLATRTVRLQGTVAQLEAAFQTKLFKYAYASGPYRGRVGAIYVPSALKNIVQAVFGLDSRRVAQRRRCPARAVHRTAGASRNVTWFTPARLAARYNFPRVTAADKP